jgi:hypothetical protein
MMTKTKVCEYDGTCSLFRESVEIVKAIPLWINKYVTGSENPLTSLEEQSSSYELHLYLKRDISQYPQLLFDDISDKGDKVTYRILANVKQNYADPEYQEKISANQQITISNIKSNDLTQTIVVSKNDDVIINVVS